jgi:NAD(P)-dependent dehydrogenase (short-subunit alcohol dehydrogenase family)
MYPTPWSVFVAPRARDYAVYGATKAAVAQLTRNLRAELGPRGVRVKNVEPGVVMTELGDDMQDPGGREGLAELRRQVGPIEPADIADAIAFAVAAPPQVNGGRNGGSNHAMRSRRACSARASTTRHMASRTTVSTNSGRG